MANTTNSIAGTAYLTIDGVSQPARGEFNYSCALVERESVVGMDGVHGYMERPKVPFIEGVLTNRAGLDLQAINALSNATVVLELANGKTVIGRNMWATEAQEASVDEGKVKVRFEGTQGSVTENN